MNGSAPHPATKHAWETTAAEICVFIPHEAGVRVLVHAVAVSSSSDVEPGTEAEGTRVALRRRTGSSRIVHAFAENACIPVPLCGAGFQSVTGFEELPPPPAHLGPYRRCRTCQAIAGRMER
jgi:hypothetical protein